MPRPGRSISSSAARLPGRARRQARRQVRRQARRQARQPVWEKHGRPRQRGLLCVGAGGSLRPTVDGVWLEAGESGNPPHGPGRCQVKTLTPKPEALSIKRSGRNYSVPPPALPLSLSLP